MIDEDRKKARGSIARNESKKSVGLGGHVILLVPRHLEKHFFRKQIWNFALLGETRNTTGLLLSITLFSRFLFEEDFN